MLAFITGSGFYTLPGLEGAEDRRVVTRFGEATVTVGTMGGRPVAFLPRHGRDHSIAPHRIDYRANLAALDALGVSAIVATAVSGSLHPEVGPGSLRLIDQFIDLTWGRASTFFDEEVRHVDMSEPYDPDLRAALLDAARAEGVELIPTGTYVCFNGPRFETPAEIEMARRMGGDLVGMTGCPEVILARELGIRYASVGVVSNLAAGLSAEPLSVDDIVAIVDEVAAVLHRVIDRALPALFEVAG